MGISITDLPKNMQMQALRKLAEEERRSTARKEIEWDDSPVIDNGEKPKRRNKYHAQKVTLPLSDGTEHTFDSKHEAEVYQGLALRERSGEISNLRIQVPYVLFPTTKAPSGKTYRPCRYIADFVYVDNATGETVVADAKGMRTKEYAVKKKWLLRDWGIEIKEV